MLGSTWATVASHCAHVGPMSRSSWRQVVQAGPRSAHVPLKFMPSMAQFGASRPVFNPMLQLPYSSTSKSHPYTIFLSVSSLYICTCIRIYIYGGCPKLCYPKTALTPRFREPFAPFRAPAESGHGIMIGLSFIYIQTFREPYAALSRPFATAAKHTHPYLQMSLGY